MNTHFIDRKAFEEMGDDDRQAVIDGLNRAVLHDHLVSVRFEIVECIDDDGEYDTVTTLYGVFDMTRDEYATNGGSWGYVEPSALLVELAE